MVEVFARKNSSVRSLRYCRATLHNNWQRRPEDDELLRKLGCIPMARYSDMMANNSFRLEPAIRNGGEVFYGQHEEMPFCFMVNHLPVLLFSRAEFNHLSPCQALPRRRRERIAQSVCQNYFYAKRTDETDRFCRFQLEVAQ